MLDVVLRNLILNAIKFTSTFGTVRITAKQIKDNLVEISVADTGIGITPEDIGELFKVKTARTYGTDGEKGNGLGLVLCKELIEKCGGTIGVESEVGKWSRFYLHITKNETHQPHKKRWVSLTLYPPYIIPENLLEPLAFHLAANLP